ncbi:predicted protein, partial [Arabidopsis lyrata subsp. lyrata]
NNEVEANEWKEKFFGEASRFLLVVRNVPVKGVQESWIIFLRAIKDMVDVKKVDLKLVKQILLVVTKNQVYNHLVECLLILEPTKEVIK